MTDIPDEIIERCARAIATQMIRYLWGTDAEIENSWRSEKKRELLKELARAALTAVRYGEMREACELMVKWFDAENDHKLMPDFYHRMELCGKVEKAARAALSPDKETT